MPSDNRLSRMLHVLIHMDHIGEPVTSETIGRMLATNPVVVRRTMAGLRTAGYLTSVKGHGGGRRSSRSACPTTIRGAALNAPSTPRSTKRWTKPNSGF
jgi:DNA-binding IscR family transcriptional regulator